MNDSTTISYNLDYVDSISFEPRTLPQQISKENGILPGRFSVSQTKRVKFSMGNLQYQASTGTWRFAQNQYDIIGDDNENISSDYDGWIDLFGWSTSGYNNCAPYLSSNKSSYGNGQIEGSNYDWGVYNAISNGGEQAGMWRILSFDEWYYLVNYRENASNLRSYAQVNGVNGWIFLPDNWILPDSLKFEPSTRDKNIYTAEEWEQMEIRGAIFLPSAGQRDGTNINYLNSAGKYWTSASKTSNSMAYSVEIKEGPINILGNSKYYGCSVRLVVAE